MTNTISYDIVNLRLGHFVPFLNTAEGGACLKNRIPDKKETILRFIDEYYEMFGRSPAIREIETGTGISKSAIGRYLLEMGTSDEIRYEGGSRKAHTAKTSKHSEDFISVGLIGNIACGEPNFAEENVEEYFRLPVSLVGSGEFYFLRAFGDSMIDIGINEGDLVLVRKQETALPGQIVVALIGDETTLKRFYPEPQNRRIRLHPENREMQDIFVESCSIQGIAVKVLKDLI